MIWYFLATVSTVSALTLRANERVRRFVNGEDADITKWTFHATLTYKPEANVAWKTCSASLIESKWLVTAAHCVRNKEWKNIGPNDFFVMLSDGPSSKSRYTVEEVYTPAYPDFGQAWTMFDNDIALIKLQQGAPTYMERVKYRNKASELNSCKAAGWGVTSEITMDDYTNGNYELANKLQVIGGSMLNYGVYCDDVAPEKKLCFGEVNGQTSLNGACVGDSGSPVVCTTEHGKTIIGIVIGGDGKCLPSTVIVTDIRPWVEWIQSKIGNRAF